MTTLARYESDATDDAGNLLTNVSVEVRLESGGLVSVYSDRAGATPLGNPFTSSDGHVGFHVAGGAYKITFTAGANSRVRRYVAIGLASETDAVVGSVNGQTGATVLLKSSEQIENLGLAFSVGSSALTCAVKQADGSTDASSTAPIYAGMRSATLTSGAFNQRSITGALSLTVPSTATLGHTSAVAGNLYWYLIDNAGTLELAVSATDFGRAGRASTTTIAGGSNTAATMYSATGRSNVPFRKIASTIDTQTVAGTWAAVPTTVQLSPTADDTKLAKSSNLSDLASASTARTNLGALGVVRTQVFTSSGTYTPNANMVYCVIECVGGGGGGGGCAGTVGQINAGGGAGTGGYSRLLASAATIGASKAVTIGAAGSAGSTGNNSGGAGGATSVGTLCIANGGGAGAGGGAGGGGQAGGGASAGTGDIAGAGASGTPGTPASITTVLIYGGAGASTLFGAGGAATFNGNGIGATGYGAGGGGGHTDNAATNRSGGAGAPGLVIVTEFCSQ